MQPTFSWSEQVCLHSAQERVCARENPQETCPTQRLPVASAAATDSRLKVRAADGFDGTGCLLSTTVGELPERVRMMG